MGSSPLQNPLHFTLEGMTRTPTMGMTEGSLGGWNENDWVPFRLTADNPSGNDATFEAAINMEYQNNGKIGIDAFADCFSVVTCLWIRHDTDDGRGYRDGAIVETERRFLDRAIARGEHQ